MRPDERERQISEQILQPTFVCPFAPGEARRGRLQYTHLTNTAHFSTTGHEIQAGLNQFAERGEGAWVITAESEPQEHVHLQRLLRAFQAHVLAIVAKPAFEATAEPLAIQHMHGKLTGLSGMPPAYLNRFAKKDRTTAPGYTQLYKSAEAVQGRVQAISTEVQNRSIFMIGMGPTYVWPKYLQQYAPAEIPAHPRYLPVPAMVVTWLSDIEQGMQSRLAPETTRRMASHPFVYNPTELAPSVRVKNLVPYTRANWEAFVNFCRLELLNHPNMAEINFQTSLIPVPPRTSPQEYFDSLISVLAQHQIYFRP
jgi:hypothetical protein